MKKLKWILLIITIIMMAFFLFATCRKTKAVEMDEIYSVFHSSNTTQVITSQDTNSGFAGMYYFGDPNNVDDFVNNLPIRISWSNGYIYVRYTVNVGYYSVIEVIYYDANNVSTSISYIYMSDRNFGFYLILGEDANEDLHMDIVVLGYQTSNNNTYVAYSHNYFDFNDYNWGLDINMAYNSQAGITIDYLFQKYFDGMFNAYWFDCLDYSLTFSEMVADICDKLVLNVNQVFINRLYLDGYTAGYQSGYDDGYSAGETAGYTAGYSAGETAGYTAGYSAGEGEGYREGYDIGYDDGYDAGLTAGYNNGYADGLADNAAGQTEAYNAGYGQGRHDGYVEGYDRGYNLGYDDGLANGMSGATPVSQTIGVVSSIFAGIGTVLSVQLFPGFPLGILILVPLFFAVLGLILWIWRRN